MQQKEVKVQETKEMQQEVAQAKENEKRGEDILWHENKKKKRQKKMIERHIGNQMKRRRCLHHHFQKKTVVRSNKYLKPKKPKMKTKKRGK